MRWIKRKKPEPKIKPEPQLGSTRICNRFLWWPLCIQNEYRWLERTTWFEKFDTHIYVEPIASTIVSKKKWISQHWVNL